MNTPITASDKTTNKARKPPLPLALRMIGLGFRTLGPVFPGLSGRVAYDLWVTPPRFKTPQPELDSLQDSVQSTVELNGHSIRTYTWGNEQGRASAPRILLVHGWSGRGTQLAPFVPDLLEKGFQVVSFDAPAHGQSSGKQTNMYEIADAIYQLEQHLGGFDGIITHSFGGPSLAVAMKTGLRTGCVVNISPPSSVHGLIEKFSDALTLPDKVRRRIITKMEQNFGDTVWQDAAMEHNIRDIDIPALVIHDVDDVDVPWHEGQSIAEAWTRVRFIRTEGLGHRRILKDPATIRCAVDFVAQHIRSKPAPAETEAADAI